MGKREGKKKNRKPIYLVKELSAFHGRERGGEKLWAPTYCASLTWSRKKG